MSKRSLPFTYMTMNSSTRGGTTYTVTTLVLCLALLQLCSVVPVAESMSVFIDPAKDNKDLEVCAFHNGTQTEVCSFDRLCASDPQYNDNYVCLHKTLFPHVSLYDIMGTLAVFLGTLFAAAGGIGGGGLFLPLLLLIFNFIVDEAVPLSHSTVFGNSIAQFIVNCNKRNMDSGELLIDYSVALLLLPSQLAGNNLGILIGQMLPGDIVVLLSVLLLVFVTGRVTRHGVHTWHSERTSKDFEDVEATLDKTLLSPELNGRIRTWYKDVPANVIFAMLGFWLCFTIDYFLVGGSKGGSIIEGLKYCSWQYWLLYVAIYPLVIAVVLFTGHKMLKKQQQSTEYSSDENTSHSRSSKDGSQAWTGERIASVCTLAVVVGMLAGLLGLGGGEFMGPLLLEIGLDPASASATSAFMIVWTTSSNVIHYILLGELPVGYTVWLMSLGLLGGLVGRFVALRFVRRHNKSSYVVFALACCLATSAILMTYRASTSIREDIDNGVAWWSLHGLCSK
eukprot:GFYU01005978.1.p1 GENE.GFYU01005978.1~~GFYU01005978.1.p1  ORF type:complete len:507 (-),score=168.80 GFYU01005978.1:58-1578(-)